MEILALAQSKTAMRKTSGTNGGEWVGPCPDCGGRDRFHVWPEKRDSRRSERVGIYWCRGCGKAGDVVRWFVDFEGMDFAGAFRALGEEMPDGYKNRHTTPRPPAPPKPPAACALKPDTHPTATSKLQPDVWLAKAAALVEHAEKALAENKYILGWLKKRGISKKTATGMRIGWLGEDHYRPRSAWGLPDEIKENGQPKKLWIPSGLVIPMIDAGGSVRRIRVRRFEDKPPRYVVVPGSSMTAMAHLLPNRAAVVVESELDGIMLAARAGEIAGVIALGSATAKPGAELTAVLADSSVILVALDSDRAGAEAMAWWRQSFPRSKRWPVPAGKDPGDAFSAGVDVCEWIKAGLPPGWFLGPSPIGLVSGGEEARQAKSEAPVPEEMNAGGGAPTDSGIDELAALLRAHPVQVRVAADGSRVVIRENQKWKAKNWDTARRISELVFFNHDVLDYLIAHGAQIIDGKNIIKC